MARKQPRADFTIPWLRGSELSGQISRSPCVAESDAKDVAQAPKLALVVAMDTLGLEQSLRLLKTTEVNHEASTGASWMKSFILSIAICEGDVRWPHDCRAALMVSWTNWLFVGGRKAESRSHSS